MLHIEQIESLKQQIISRYTPDKIILFGSCAKGIIRSSSDIDLCIIKQVDKIRELKMDMQLNLESEIPFDIVVYTPEAWKDNVNDETSFAYLISEKGVVLYG